MDIINYALAKKEWDKAYGDVVEFGSVGRNLIVRSEVSVSRWVDDKTGIVNSSNNHRLTNYIEVIPNTHYVLTGHNPLIGQVRIVSFNGDREYISGSIYVGRQSNPIIYIAPSEAMYVRISADSTYGDYDGWKFEKGNKATQYSLAPEDAGLHPFVANLSEIAYQSRANKEDMEELRNAVTSMGGSV